MVVYMYIRKQTQLGFKDNTIFSLSWPIIMLIYVGFSLYKASVFLFICSVEINFDEINLVLAFITTEFISELNNLTYVTRPYNAH